MSLIALSEKLNTTQIAGVQAGAGAVVLAAAYAFQHLGGVQPCVLCLYQRWPWWIAVGLGCLVVLLRGRPGVALGVAATSSLAILFRRGPCGLPCWCGTALVGGLVSCGGAVGMPTSVEALKQQIMSALVVRCDEVAWSLFGISMAGYNFLISLASVRGGSASSGAIGRRRMPDRPGPLYLPGDPNPRSMR